MTAEFGVRLVAVFAERGLRVLQLFRGPLLIMVLHAHVALDLCIGLPSCWAALHWALDKLCDCVRVRNERIDLDILLPLGWLVGRRP